MDRDSFSAALNRRQKYYTERWGNNITFRCERVDLGDNIYVYRLQADSQCQTQLYPKYKVLYCTSEADEKTALHRAEEIEALIALSSSLFSWIGD
jgi:uncharacterized protein YihD (DUF1040 family)